MSSINTEKSPESTGDQYFQGILNHVLEKLKEDPASITTEDARRLSENAVAGDLRTAKIISAVEAFAAASEVIHEVDPQLGQAPHTSLLTVVNDLKVAVDQNPTNVTTEVLRTAQNVVSKMQKAVGHTNAPHPELESELRQEIAKIEPKVVEGTVTIEEANHLHSLEARAHGHTEKGGITSIAQSVAAKRERQLSLSSGSSPVSSRSRANSKTFSPQEQSHRDREINLQKVKEVIKPKIELATVTGSEANLLYSREARVRGQTEMGGLTASAQPVVSQKRHDSLSDHTNASAQGSAEEQFQRDREVNLKLAEMSLESNNKNETEKVSKEGAASVQSREHRAHGHVDKGGLASHAMAAAHKRENSQPSIEVN
ncbi:hypothetical protein BDU57DRAFT_504737 [Ampelomyces quisqualis]|uniref:SMP domain-containing protein n=1 Tax=Ampelomyces quisqualis TaxID=50730 RepID=A0A6A5QA24_AMPQU|nr:hypothetical protein BDU57DRAFT_504737 [Ampelomyces quisqualis]